MMKKKTPNKTKLAKFGLTYSRLLPLNYRSLLVVTMAVVAAAGISLTLMSYASTNDTLSTGQSLSAGQNLYSSTKNMRLAMQTDGNLVIYASSGKAVWTSGTYGTGSNNRLTMQTDGNLIIYTAANKAVWASHTWNTGTNNHLVMQTDGNLVIYTSSGKAVWQSGTYGAGTTTTTPGGSTSHSNPLAGDKFFVMPYQYNYAAQAAASNPSQAFQLNKIANQSTAYWITPQSPDSNNQSIVNKLETQAIAANQVPVFVMYAITNRDCGLYSSGGESSDLAYKSLVNYVKAGIGGRKAVVILEPDSLTELKTCLNSTQQSDRLSLLRYASDTLSVPGTSVYMDAGNAFEQGTIAASVSYMLPLLEAVDINKDAGFELDTSLDQYTKDEQNFGDQMVAALQKAGITNKGYTIDTSRNGNGPAGNPLSAYCNLPHLGLGTPPSSVTSDPLNDAYLWVKYPGQSDGSCKGAGVPEPSYPPSGVFWPAYAIGLAEGNAP